MIFRIDGCITDGQLIAYDVVCGVASALMNVDEQRRFWRCLTADWGLALIFIGSITGGMELGVASSLKNADGQRRVQEDKNQKKDMRSSLTDDGLAFDISGRTLQHVFLLQRLNSCNVSFASQPRQYI